MTDQNPPNTPDAPQNGTQEPQELSVGFAQQIDEREYAAIRRGMLADLRQRAHEFQAANTLPMAAALEMAWRSYWEETRKEKYGE